ncbi:DUF5994 family protein [Jatrophihabitans sp. DSM 45814]
MTVIDTTEPTLHPANPLVESVARVRFRQPVSGAGFVDAGWWPRSRSLAIELPPLLEELWTAGREITRVAYNLDFWAPAPKQLIVEGRTIKLGGYRMQNPSLLSMMDLWSSERIDVLVIDPDADPEFAHRALEIASQPGPAPRHGADLSGAGGYLRPADILRLAATSG